MTIRSFSPMLAGAVVGLTWQILVIFGLHWGLLRIHCRFKHSSCKQRIQSLPALGQRTILHSRITHDFIGNHVPEVYADVMPLLGLEEGGANQEEDFFFGFPAFS